MGTLHICVLGQRGGRLQRKLEGHVELSLLGKFHDFGNAHSFASGLVQIGSCDQSTFLLS